MISAAFCWIVGAGIWAALVLPNVTQSDDE
jgi:hypothetical protein